MRLLLPIFLLFISELVYGQTSSFDTARTNHRVPLDKERMFKKIIVTGRIVDNMEKEPLPGAHIFYGKDKMLMAVSDGDGKFSFQAIDTITSQLSVSFTGHESWTHHFVKKAKQDTLRCGDIYLLPMMLDEIVISATPPLSVQRGDTTQFNVDAVKLAADANLENLLKRLPGFEIIDGKIMAQGRVVEKLYVDGTTYFLDDPKGALKNLPANLISKIKLFDDRSEEAKFSGYDDGSKFRSLNIETKNPNKPKYFGDFTVGYGISEKIKETFKDNNYRMDGNVSFFDSKRRLTIDGGWENTDQADKLNDAKYNGKGGNNSDHNLGMNFSYNQRDKVSFTGMYRMDGGENYSGSLQRQDYFKTERYDSRIYDNESHNWSDRTGHNINTRFEYYLNEKNRISFSPNISLSENTSQSLSYAQNVEDNDTINRSETVAENRSDNQNYQGNLSWMHAFKKKGRTLTLQGNYGYGINNSFQLRKSKERNLNNDNQYVDTLRNQKTSSDQTNYNLWASLAYSEPLSENSRISFQYSHQESRSKVKKWSYSYRDSTFQELIGIDTALTNTLNNRMMMDRVGINFNIQNKKISFSGGTSLNFTQMRNSYKYLSAANDSIVNSNYIDISPRADIRYTLSNNSSFSLNYYGNTTSPTAEQLQDVLNVANPLQVSTGNPNLDKSYQQSLSLFFDRSAPEHSRFLTFRLSAGQTFNKIASNVCFLDRDTLINGYEVLRGARFTSPVNLNGDWNIDTDLSYSFPVEKLKLRFNTSFSGGFTHTPNIYDNEHNFSDAYNGAFTLGVSTNISEDFDFMFSSRSSYSNTKNSSTGRSEYFDQTVNAYLLWVFWKGFFVGGNFDYQYYLNKKEDAINQSNKRLNTYVGKKFGKRRAAELRFSLNDIFREQDQISYQLSDLYSSTSLRTQTTNYYMVSFTYRFNSMQKGGNGIKDIPMLY